MRLVHDTSTVKGTNTYAKIWLTPDREKLIKQDTKTNIKPTSATGLWEPTTGPIFVMDKLKVSFFWLTVMPLWTLWEYRTITLFQLSKLICKQM